MSFRGPQALSDTPEGVPFRSFHTVSKAPLARTPNSEPQSSEETFMNKPSSLSAKRTPLSTPRHQDTNRLRKNCWDALWKGGASAPPQIAPQQFQKLRLRASSRRG